MAMKQLILLLCLSVSLLSCKKESTTVSDAVITGYDARLCACCGGLMINFENNPDPYTGTFYLINEMPANSGITTSSTFPIYLKVEWEKEPTKCPDHFINIRRIIP
jgi:hypothetical protein